MMRIASVLLVAVLLSTCAIFSTFAKYVTQASSSDEARVAYWGFTTTSTTFSIADLFENTYDNVSSNTNVIAPGTAGYATFSFKPQNETAPEVAYKISVSVNGSDCDADLVANTNIQWNLDQGEDAPDNKWGSFADLLTAIDNLDAGSDETPISAGTFPTEKWGIDGQLTHTIYWRWLINESSDATNAQNEKDTALGNKAISEPDKVAIKITIVAEQVD